MEKVNSVEQVLNSIENRKNVTAKLIEKLNLVWCDVVSAMSKENLSFTFSNGFEIGVYLQSNNYGTWHDIYTAEERHRLTPAGKLPGDTGYWAGNFNYHWENMNRAELLKLANDTKTMLLELSGFQQKRITEIETALLKLN